MIRSGIKKTSEAMTRIILRETERNEFIDANLPSDKTSGTDKQILTADEMSIFYKTFLDKNCKVHIRYNVEWYRKNIGLVICALRVKIFKVKRWFMSNSR
ncbi:hypothetical protein L798_07822 [Zootermopsis nevadensis]|uniref:Uncharacterized protein n=1 Tax=Zootermopsis nevadensis TaxID=136037 RepID=A0A067RDJ3_ZOONE|nr:hypothetical protein L798_07822 [Zootermopsis nevadensis]